MSPSSPLLDGLLLGARPKQHLPLLDYAEEHIKLPHSDRARRFNRRQAPHLNPIFEAIENPNIREIVVCAPVGSGKTTVFEVVTPWIIDQEPGPTKIVFQSDADGKDWAESRLDGVLKACEPIKPLFPKNRHAKRKTRIFFPHMFLMIDGANINNLQGDSIRYGIGDEVWLWKRGLVAEFKKRLHDRTNGKFALFSQAGVEGDDFHTEQDACDQWEFQFECPSCHRIQPWRQENFVYDRQHKKDGSTDWKHFQKSVHLPCSGCSQKFQDDTATRRALADSGRALKVKDGLQENWAYTYPAFAVWWIPWWKLMVEWVKANDEEKRGDKEPLRQYKQKRLAQRWEDQGSRARDEDVLKCRGEYDTGKLPIEPVMITVCTDSGERETHWSACAWTAGGNGYIFDYGTVLAPEDMLDLVASKKWKTAAGNEFQTHAGLMDSGFWTERVYAVCARSKGVLFPCKGSGAEMGAWRRSEIQEHASLFLYTFVDYQAKAELYLGKIGMRKPPYLYFPRDASEDFLRGHMGQRLVIPKGGKRKDWAKVAGDHYGDCSKEHLVCWWILGSEFAGPP